MRSDLSAASRALVRSPLVTLIAIVSLGLGIGANVAVFSLVNAFFMRPLPVPAPDELVSVYAHAESQLWRNLSYPDVLDLREGSRQLAGLAAFTTPGLRVSMRIGATGGEVEALSGGESAPPEGIAASLVTSDYFSVLGVRPLRGRFFGGGGAEGDGSAVVLGERFWRERWAADPSIVGREVWLNRRPFRVVGIAPAGFMGTFTGIGTDVWLPLSRHRDVIGGADSLHRRDSRFLNAIGRLAPGATRDGVLAEMSAIAARLAVAHPETNEGFGVNVTEATGVPVFIRRFVGPFVALLMGMVGLVLVVACVNVAGLLLARASVRVGEFVLRASLGAPRWRIARPLLLECALLALAGGVVGIAVGRAALAVLLSTVPPLGIPFALDVGLDRRVFVFALSLTACTVFVFGLLPVVRATRVDLVSAIRRTSLAGGSGRVRAGLIVVQIALSVLLLVSAGLLARGLERVSDSDPGFDPDGIAVFTSEPSLLNYDAEAASRLANAQVSIATSVPGVAAAGAARFAPLGPRGDDVPVVLEGPGGDADTVSIAYNAVTPGFLGSLEIPVLRGRDFGAGDDESSEAVAIVNEAMTRRFWPDDEALGRRFEIRGTRFTVIGIARDAKYRSFGEGARPFVYLPFAQQSLLRVPPGDLVLHVRASARPELLLRPVRDALLSLDPDLPVDAARMRDVIAFTLFPSRLARAIAAVCGALALLLACVGLYGTAAFAVSRRTREIGIRFAVGARRADIARLILGQSGRIAVVGVALGLPAALAASALLRSLLFGVPRADPWTYASVVVLLFGAVLLASWVPARRAARVQPVVALRAD